MKKYFSPRLIIVTCLFLSAFYFYLLHPASGFLGGLLFILGGQYFPSVINLLLSYFLISLINIANKTYKLILFILFSFIIGMNTNLFYLRNFKPSNVNLTVIHPLKNPGSLASIGWDNSEGDIYAYPLEVTAWSADEGCACAYFTVPQYLYSQVRSMGSDGKPENFVKIFKPSGTGAYADGDYLFRTHKQNIGAAQVKLTIEIKDRFNGYAIISGVYPKSLVISDPRRYKLSEDPYFWRRSFDSFFHDNFWNNFIYKLPKVESVFDCLRASDIQKLFKN